jgi:DNA-binding transcriptional ArsR family regulator
MKQSFTKIYEKERELLRKANSVSAYEVYFHLKNDNSYFKKEFMDLNRCIAEYLDYSIDTVKRAMVKLKEVGLIQTKKKGKVNYYILPYDSQNIDIITYKEEYDETTGNDIGTTDSISEEDKTGDIGTEQLQDIHPLQENEQKQLGEETNPKPDSQAPTDDEILMWIQQGYEVEYIVKNWRSIRKIMVS